MQAEREIERMKVYANFIQLKAKPAIFYAPAKHTLRTLELHKNTQRKFEGATASLHKSSLCAVADKIAQRRQELDADLKMLEERVHKREENVNNDDEWS